MKRYSILNNLDKCFFCGKNKENTHEVYFGKNRQTSIKNGFCVGLCFRCHSLVHDGASYPQNETMDKHLKVTYQKEFEKNNSRGDFIRMIGKSYL